MDTDPQHEAGLPHRAPNGHADSEIQSNDLPEAEANSRLSTIREMARDFQVSIRALRFYEDRGLLHPRRENTNRRYDARDRLHLKMILKGKQLGFTLSEIHDILGCRGEDSGNSRWDCCRSRSRRRSATSNASAAKSMRLSRPCVRRIGGCPNRLAKARVLLSDPAIRAGAEIVGRVFRQGPAPTLAPISAISLVAFVFASLHQTDEGLGAFRYPCLAVDGKNRAGRKARDHTGDNGAAFDDLAP
jgi:DNA-binding transcriptional MerR regulator